MDSSFPTDPEAVLAFWRDAGPGRWFRKDEAFDAEFRERFLAAHEAAARGELGHWMAGGGEAALALLVLLDQFPRNAFRGTPRMYATDEMARELALAAIARGLDQAVEPGLRNFFYLPLMHSERLEDQEQAVELAGRLGPEPLHHAEVHHDVVARFGRFPHRNPILGRESTAEEVAFLAGGGFGG